MKVVELQLLCCRLEDSLSQGSSFTVARRGSAAGMQLRSLLASEASYVRESVHLQVSLQLQEAADLPSLALKCTIA